MQSDEKRNGSAPLKRRELLLMAAGAGLALVLPAAALARGDKWVAIGKSSLFVLNEPRQVVLPGDAGTVWVTRTAKNKVSAVSAKCTHKGCTVGWDGPTKTLLCPCHGAAFQSDGKNLHGTKRSPDTKLPNLPAVPVKESGGQVMANLTAATAAIAPAPAPAEAPH